MKASVTSPASMFVSDGVGDGIDGLSDSVSDGAGDDIAAGCQ